MATPDNSVDRIQAPRGTFKKMDELGMGQVGDDASKIVLDIGIPLLGPEDPPAIQVGVLYRNGQEGRLMAAFNIDQDDQIDYVEVVPERRLPETPSLSQLLKDTNRAIGAARKRGLVYVPAFSVTEFAQYVQQEFSSIPKSS